MNIRQANTASIGIEGYPADGSTLDLLLACADRNMYQPRLAGRNRIVAQAAAPTAAITTT